MRWHSNKLPPLIRERHRIRTTHRGIYTGESLKMTLDSLTVASRRSPEAHLKLELGNEADNFKAMDSSMEGSMMDCNK